MNGALASLAILGGALAWGAVFHGKHEPPHRKHWYERVAAILAGAATFALMLSLAGPWGALWTLTGEGVGLLVLFCVLAGAAVFSYHTIIRGRRHHRDSTIALGVVLGGSIALLYGGFDAIHANTGKALAQAGDGLTTTAGSTGAHPHGHATSGGGEWAVVLLLIVAAICIGIIISRHRQGAVQDVPKPDAKALPRGGSGRPAPSYGSD